MATVNKGQVTATGEWRKHLRDQKREFAKAERKAARAVARRESPFEGSELASCKPLRSLMGEPIFQRAGCVPQGFT